MTSDLKRVGIGLSTICCMLDAPAAGEDKVIAKLIRSVSHAMVELRRRNT